MEVFIAKEGAMDMKDVVREVAPELHIRPTTLQECVDIALAAEPGQAVDDLRAYCTKRSEDDGRGTPRMKGIRLPEHIPILLDIIKQKLRAKEIYITGEKFAQCISEDDRLGDGEQVHISEKAARHLLERLGFRPGMLNKYCLKLTSARKERIEKFLREYKLALKKQADGTHVIVYMDESYVHDSHCRRYGWLFEGDGRGRDWDTINGKAVEVQRTATKRDGDPLFDDVQGDAMAKNKGSRLILLNAFTKDGFVGPAPDANGVYPRTSACTWGGVKLDAEQESAAWVFPASASFKDYHKNMDGFMFMKWMKNCLIPAFKKQFGDKKMILVLDNAGYHHGDGDDTWRPDTKTKEQNLAYLEKEGKKSLLYWRGEGYTDAGSPEWVAEAAEGEAPRLSWRAKAPRGPSAEEVAQGLTLWLKATHPDRLKEPIEVLMNEHQYELIWSPPYCPNFQPIERVWGWSKNKIATLWYSTRKVKDTFAQLMGVWFGGDLPNPKGAPVTGGFTPALAQSFIAQAEEDMNKWILNSGVRCRGKMRGTEADTFMYDSGLEYENDGGVGEEYVDEEHDQINDAADDE